MSTQVNIAEWSSSVARRAHNPKVVGSNPASATRRMYDHAAAWSYIFYVAKRQLQVAHTKSSGPPQPLKQKDIQMDVFFVLMELCVPGRERDAACATMVGNQFRYIARKP